MKIKEISIRGYRGITEMTLNPERINVFIGECGSGKSSVLEALRFALGGKAEKAISVQLTMKRMRLQLQLFLKTVLL